MRNLDVREEAKNAGVKLWEIADILGIADFTLSRKLRHELPDGEKERIRSIIHEIAAKEAG